MATLEERVAAVEQQLATVSAEKEHLKRRLWWWRGAAALTLLCGFLLGVPRLGEAQGTLDQRVAVLEGKLARVSTANGGADIIIAGANLNIINGLSNTQSSNGLGNLILGYNEARGGGLDVRTGSHNLVLGQQNNYSSFGGIVGGYQNTIAGPFSHVLTGNGNAATQFYALVGTGQFNNAANTYAAVFGGELNVASGVKSCVSGGISNSAGALLSTVGGGAQETIPAGGLNTYDWRAAEMLFQDAAM
jgi:hypothetical protein